MAFTINQTGIERGATQLLFPSAPIIIDRHREEPADAAHAIAITGAPIVVQFGRTQQKSELRMRIRLLTGAEVTTLNTLMAGSGPVVVKLTPGSATTINCMFGPREEQEVVPYSGDYATAKMDGSAVDPLLEQHHAELFLLRV
jgi:hypothetical protein